VFSSIIKLTVVKNSKSVLIKIIEKNLFTSCLGDFVAMSFATKSQRFTKKNK